METKITFKRFNGKWRAIVETRCKKQQGSVVEFNSKERQRAVLEDNNLKALVTMAMDEMEMQQNTLLFMKWVEENKF